jgi:hypothetical protein
MSNWHLTVDTTYCLSSQDKLNLLQKPERLFYLQQLDPEKNPDHVPFITNFVLFTIFGSGPGSSVGIVTGYGLDGPGIESRWGGEIFRTRPDRPWGPPSLLYNGYRVFPGGKGRPGRDADPKPPSSAVVMKE